MFFGNKKLIGLDIGSSSVKIAELDLTKRGATLVSFGMMATPPGALVSGEIIDSEALAITVQSLSEEINTKRKSVVTGLWGSTVIVKRISVPKMEESILAEQIRWEAEQYIPFAVNEVHLGYHLLNSKKSNEMMDLLLVAAIKENVMKNAEVIELAGLGCEIVDLSGFALANCYEKNYTSKVIKGEATALINLGAFVSNLILIESGQVVFCRDIPVGGNLYTEEIQKRLSISFEEAEAMKISYSNSQEVPEEVGGSIQATHEVLYEDINSNFEFFLNTSDAETIGQCYITGGCSLIPGLHEEISKAVPTDLLDPFSKVKFSGKSLTENYIDQIRPFASIVMGLGLRKVGDQ